MSTLQSAHITASIMYKSEKGYLDELCINIPNLSDVAVFIPHIGETFIDRKRNEEYEVQDVIRSLYGNEYVIQVQLKKRERKRYRL